MIQIELDSGDINKLVKAGAGLSGKSFLNEKLSNFCLRDGNSLTFDQSFKMSTTPQVRLSEDGAGKLVIEIQRLADSSIGNLFLQPFNGVVTGIIADKTRGVLQKKSSSELTLDIGKFLPGAKLKKVSGNPRKLTLEIALK